MYAKMNASLAEDIEHKWEKKKSVLMYLNAQNIYGDNCFDILWSFISHFIK